ncbi:hypothetical protein Lche_2947 [Legionella cherrii]|uniref:Thaumatin domain-containing protein n=1 Tax=Legionella cherrii TaxID=28084 RepID=A0A0W0SBI1_9GAMM|nr:hypothetical protein [Legionella cherrii]KTC80927.1 hypothetical protein Lche_2947 [Legionella cherrii]
MTQYLRYFIFTTALFVSMTCYAVDRNTCTLADKGISDQSQAGQTYSTTSNCTGTHRSEVTTTASAQPSTAIITWPSSNSGSAQADITGNGVGSFVANAIDSSGHPVSYTFKISGPGTITGTQTGTFNLTGVDATTVITITAVADDATPVVGAPITVQVSNVPTKVLYFYNNTSEPIYPVIEAPILPVDTWMQAQFAVTDPSYTFTATHLHRVYVNGIHGIPPMQSALVSVPFYSYLVPNPTGGNTADQYVDWWSSMRVYIYDVQSYLIQTQSEAGVSPVTLFTPGPTCISGCSQTSVYSATSIMPTNDPQQLTEYTFAAVVPTQPLPYSIDRTIVNYDYSAVDQVYLPVAMEPYGANQLGYTGTVVDLTSFRSSLNTFLSGTQWPVYAGLPYPRIPGAFNVVIGNSQLTSTAAQTAALTAYWNNCSTNPASPDFANCIAVFNLFDANYFACNGTHLSGPTALPVENIYGYIAFCATPLPSSGAGFDAYTALQYNYKNHSSYAQDFNSYTSLIHQALQMNVYAYSVDDAVGFISTLGNGLVITVGGATGLPNSQQYNPQQVITVSPGTPAVGSPFPVFTHYGVCSQTASSSLGRGSSFKFQLPSTSFPCVITLEDSLKRLYHFTLKAPAPLTSTAADISCAAEDQPWCSSVVVTSAQGISTAQPNP